MFDVLYRHDDIQSDFIFSTSAVSAERPSPPLNLNYCDQIKTAVTLTWETPTSNGGSMITGYIIEKCDEGTEKWLRCNARLCPDLSYRVMRLLQSLTCF